MTTAQLELSFQTHCARLTPTIDHGASFRRAQWWFRKMRQVVDSALDWQPARPPRPEQIIFPVKDFRFWTA